MTISNSSIKRSKEPEEKRKHMKHALEHVEEAMYLTKKNGDFVYANDGVVYMINELKIVFDSIK